jgi:bifunctional non-homologous end joining protein LigD
MKIKITHPNKILYKKFSITKKELYEFYCKYTDKIWPFVKERPLMILRCESAKSSKVFYQKNASAGLKNYFNFVKSPFNKNEELIYLKDKKQIANLAQINVVEIHAWNCHVKDLYHPDLIVIDLDPDESVKFDIIKKTAEAIKNIFSKNGLKSYLKWTGGKGLHVVAPIKAIEDWDTIKEFSKQLCLELVNKYPNSYTINMSKKLRKGKIYLDYLRNSRGSTSIVPYSPRFITSNVSTMIAWGVLKNRSAFVKSCLNLKMLKQN